MKAVQEITRALETVPVPAESGEIATASLTPTVTLSEAQELVAALAETQAVLLLSPPGVGKSDIVRRAAEAAGLPCRSLLGTQIAPEDVSGIPRIVGERAVFCPPRVLLPEDGQPFCLFLDELPAAAPDVQRALYSLLLERRLGEHALPPGSWVVAAGNRAEDGALVRAMSSALVNRVAIVHVRPDVREWLAWARASGVRADVLAFVACEPSALCRPVPEEPGPFSTPRAWAMLSSALDRVETRAGLRPAAARALAHGLLSPEDAAAFCAVAEDAPLAPPERYLVDPSALPPRGVSRWTALRGVREVVSAGATDARGARPDAFLRALCPEERAFVVLDLADAWRRLGARAALAETLAEMTS